jgi:26S proteasome non-ATPase regulatory subunit 10
MIAASAGRIEVVKSLLGHTQCDVNHRNNNGQTSLFYSASKNNIPITKLLLQNGADVNAQDKYGNTPLHRCASQGHLDIVRLLLDQKGIRVDMADREGNTPLHLVAEDQNDSAAIMLIRAGADINRQNKAEKTPLDLAVSSEFKRKITEAAN